MEHQSMTEGNASSRKAKRLHLFVLLARAISNQFSRDKINLLNR